MKTTGKSSWKEKTAGCLIVALVLAGAAFIPAVADMAKGGGVMATLFLAFLGAIIAVQVIPGLMLFGMMVKGICNLVRKPASEAKTKGVE
jgi:hypothetical protein